MKLLVAIVSFVALAACQQASEPETKADPQPVASTTVVAAAPAAAAAEDSCGGSCGGACGGSCGGACGSHGEATAEAAPAQAVPADATWTELKVTGMHCGNCARRIKNALAQVDGVYGVEVDVASATVKVAVGKGQDGRALATPKIDALGYRVVN